MVHNLPIHIIDGWSVRLSTVRYSTIWYRVGDATRRKWDQPGIEFHGTI